MHFHQGSFHSEANHILPSFEDYPTWEQPGKWHEPVRPFYGGLEV
jgi:hypothetical protein